jgi:hypothetical protein
MDLYMQIQFSDQNGAGIYIFIALALMQINMENKHLTLRWILNPPITN